MTSHRLRSTIPAGLWWRRESKQIPGAGIHFRRARVQTRARRHGLVGICDNREGRP
jgi:hypothetical protein